MPCENAVCNNVNPTWQRNDECTAVIKKKKLEYKVL